jgi:uncharacterized protein (DUF1330 family)
VPGASVFSIAIQCVVQGRRSPRSLVGALASMASGREDGEGGGRHAGDMLCVLAVHGLVDYSALTVERMEVPVAKAYWVVTYRTIKNQDAFAAYAQLAVPAVQEAGGRFIVRGNPAKTYEAGMNQRVVVIEFDSLEKALASHDTPAYQAALQALGDGADRDIRIVEGIG